MGQQPKKLIIDTDPGIDDAMAICAAFNSPEVEVIGLTTIFGNVRTPTATSNAFILLKLAGKEQIPVAEGASSTLSGLSKTRVADFVHGTDGFGNTSQAAVQGLRHEKNAAQFIVDMCTRFPGEIHILALGPLTNIALACQLDDKLGQSLASLVILGGAITINGNVNPAAEANIFGDPAAADYVFGRPLPTYLVPLDVTTQCKLSGTELTAMNGCGAYGSFLASITHFYLEYHRRVMGIDAVYLHDPTAFAAVILPDLFTWSRARLRVLTEGIGAGMTIADVGDKKWNSPNAWSERPIVQVALNVDPEGVRPAILERMLR
ncbi:hypothetical protein WJX73_004601 [Symbiochloris irregularis]|uniref:Inosine/uridine-preferring nucleoside hydrolase domain-containing protein n=1 Tax=Symbiochloris irregularis TaxID=706552 RepID=A0AAW1NWV1_9CHLO